ncbi:hypothetical protein [Glycomyces terrestris]|uniref:Uncharacterized protein n=1 Tax=Glycomyces terrestris TaxID=2493553 RepID=A0A426V3E9_9ACTN|nr:hypothetical protein [Glycomyces terrestris]RRS01413.1 hypothetical protein EIW28_01160 [Glycomyces terrestris]
MGADDLTALGLGLAAIAVLVTWPVLPGLRRFSGFKTFPPFKGWAVRPHPDAAVPVRAGRRLKPGAAAGRGPHAVVVVRTAWRNQDSRDVHPSLRVSRPLVPVVSIDGVPVSWGWGTTEMTVDPGDHLIAVASSHSRCYQTVDLEAGERRELDYASIIGSTAHWYAEAGAQIRDLTAFGPRRPGPGGIGGFHLVAVGGLVLAAALTAVAIASPDPTADLLVPAVIWGAAGLGLGIGIVAITASLMQEARARRIVTAAPPTGAAPLAVRVLDADTPERLAPAPGWAGLNLHLRFEIEAHPEPALAALAGGRKPGPLQRWRAIRIGEPEPPACRPWVPAPEVLLDGEPVAASWTRMWIQLAPGAHDLVVRTAPAPSQVDARTALDLSGAEIRRRFSVDAGGTFDLRCTAEVAALSAHDRPRLAAFRARWR